jgi:hypothetical protein
MAMLAAAAGFFTAAVAAARLSRVEIIEEIDFQRGYDACAPSFAQSNHRRD